ncbi:hypothetical protein ACJZ2D_001415 [Fusarium nematophilum]
MPDNQPKKTVLITGCSDGGLGAALAVTFHQRGWRVFATTRNPQKMAGLEAVGIETRALDVTSEASAEECASQIASLTGGTLDMLVNNAGRGYTLPLLDVSIEETKKLFDTNVYSVILVTKDFFPLLSQSKHKPVVVNNTSVCAVVPLPFEGTYSASKAAVSMLTQTLRLELTPFGIAVAELRTGSVCSNMNDNNYEVENPNKRLPASSPYWVGREIIEQAQRGEEVAKSSIPAEVWAEDVVKELTRSRVPPQIWKGGQAGLSWLTTWMPLGWMDGEFKRATGLDKIEKMIRERKIQERATWALVTYTRCLLPWLLGCATDSGASGGITQILVRGKTLPPRPGTDKNPVDRLRTSCHHLVRSVPIGYSLDYLLSLQAVRANAERVLAAANKGQLNHFNYDPSRMDSVSEFVINVIKRDFGPDKFNEIPPHGRWQHFDHGGVARIDPLIASWRREGNVDNVEITRRLIDLFFVSVLLDAGAGDDWKFNEAGTNATYTRSEGIAIASFHMFRAGVFMAGSEHKDRADAKGLSLLTTDVFDTYFQISPENPMLGVESRVRLLNDVGTSLLKLPEIFGVAGRPGNIVGTRKSPLVEHARSMLRILTIFIKDYLIDRAGGSESLNYEDLWSALQKLLIPSWPKDRTHIDGQPVGDAWPLQVLAAQSKTDGNESPRHTIQPFHKLTQWLGYSLMVPFVRLLGVQWTNAELGTGLPEYRNGGLFVDLGVLVLKEQALADGLQTSGQKLPGFSATSDVIVEWRAMTVALLDELHNVISEKFALEGVSLSMAQMLEAGSWKSGRELAAKYRPETRSSPILVLGDGTLF